MFREFLKDDGVTLIQFNVALVRRIESMSNGRMGKPVVRVWFDKTDFIDILGKIDDVGRALNC